MSQRSRIGLLNLTPDLHGLAIFFDIQDHIRRFIVGVPREMGEGTGSPQPMPVPPHLDFEMWLGPAPRADYTLDRVHPDSLPHEAADVLMKIIEGKTSEVVDRALADLLGL